jgi:hypothetical protein
MGLLRVKSVATRKDAITDVVISRNYNLPGSIRIILSLIEVVRNSLDCRVKPDNDKNKYSIPVLLE